MRVFYFGVAIAVGVHSMKRTPVFYVLFFLLVACNNEVTTTPRDKDSVVTTHSKSEVKSGNKQTIVNNIVLEKVSGLEITSAFLADEKGNLINPKNSVRAGQPVFLTFHINKGWTVKKGMVSPGASQSIVTHNNEPVLQSEDLFANAPRIKKEDAGIVRLKTLITSTRPDIPYYIIRFRLWDNLGTGEITGYYRLQVQP